jgi:hypothetical protein
MMNHRATACIAPPSGHPASIIRRCRDAAELGCLLLLGCVVLWLAGDEMEEET